MRPIETNCDQSREEGKGDVGETLVFLLLSSPCHWVPLGEEGLQRLGGQGGGDDDDGGDDHDDGGDDHDDNALCICIETSSIF